MAEQSLKNKTMNGLIWNIINQMANRIIVFVFSVLLARILSPADYGTVAMLNIFIVISQTFIDSGLRTALIRKQDRTEEDNNTMFYFNFVTALFFYALLWMGAPYIADFYNTPILKQVARVSGLILVIPTLAGVHGAILTAKIDFKTQSIYGLTSALLSSCVGLWLAYRGYGVWALVTQQLVASSLSVIFMYIAVKWRPRLMFSWKSFREMFGYGSKLLVTSLVDKTYDNLSTIIIGKVYAPTQLGYFSKATTFSDLPSKTVTGVLFNVYFPVLCSLQHDMEQLRKYFRAFLLLTCYIVFPAMIGLMAVADPLIRVMLTDKWADMIPFMRILCCGAIWTPIAWYNNGLLKVSGHSDYVLILEIVKKAIGVTVLAVTAHVSILAMSIGLAGMMFFSAILDTIFSRRLLGYGLYKQIKDLGHIILTSLIMGVIAYAICQINISDIFKLTIAIPSSIVFFYTVSKIFHFEELATMKKLIKDKIHG